MRDRVLITLFVLCVAVGQLYSQVRAGSGLEQSSRRIFIGIVDPEPEASVIGVTKESIQKKVELLLSKSGLSPDTSFRTRGESKGYLEIDITVSHSSFHTSLQYCRMASYESDGREYRALGVFWQWSSSGEHGDNATVILDSLDPGLKYFCELFIVMNQMRRR